MDDALTAATTKHAQVERPPMTAIDLLMREHRAIERVLDCTEIVVSAIRARREIPRVYGDILEFIVAYADGRHHAKEEGVLFETMIGKGMPAGTGPIGCMMHDHSLLRGLARRMAQSCEGFRGDPDGSVGALIASSTLYSRILAQHIRKEDFMLYPLAEQLMSAEVSEGMTARFVQTDPDGIDAFEAAASAIEQGIFDWLERIGAEPAGRTLAHANCCATCEPVTQSGVAILRPPDSSRVRCSGGAR